MFEFVPADLTTLSDEDKAALVQKLDAALVEQGQTYRTAMQQADDAERAYQTILAQFEHDHATILDTRKLCAQRRDDMKAALQQAAVTRRQLTGEATFQAFQAAESWVMDYDAGAMLKWMLTEAPGQWKADCLKLDTTRLNKLLTGRLDEFGVPRPVEGASSLPATGRRVFVGKVLADKLVAMPVKADELASSYIATLTSPELNDAERHSIPF